MIKFINQQEIECLNGKEEKAGGAGHMAIQFGVIRKYISRIDRISICMKETLNYYNYRNIREVPHSFDVCYLYGIGSIESEFDREPDLDAQNMEGPYSPARRGSRDYTFEHCMEFMVSVKPLMESKTDAELSTFMDEFMGEMKRQAGEE